MYMYELLVVIMIIFCLNGVLNLVRSKERFTAIQAMYDPIPEFANYNYSKQYKNQRLIDLPYQQGPVESQTFCPPQELYNGSCYPQPLRDRFYSDSLSGPYTVPMNQLATDKLQSVYGPIMG
jgi:hypothetical protein